jgi:hypothetical protein
MKAIYETYSRKLRVLIQINNFLWGTPSFRFCGFKIWWPYNWLTITFGIIGFAMLNSDEKALLYNIVQQYFFPFLWVYFIFLMIGVLVIPGLIVLSHELEKSR